MTVGRGPSQPGAVRSRAVVPVWSGAEASGYLVGPPVFKTGERRAAALAGSIPVRLRCLREHPAGMLHARLAAAARRAAGWNRTGTPVHDPASLTRLATASAAAAAPPRRPAP